MKMKSKFIFQSILPDIQIYFNGFRSNNPNKTPIRLTKYLPYVEEALFLSI